MDKETFIEAVADSAYEDYDIEDAADMTRNLFDMRVINLDMSLSEAATIVAQHVQQA